MISCCRIWPCSYFFFPKVFSLTDSLQAAPLRRWACGCPSPRFPTGFLNMICGLHHGQGWWIMWRMKNGVSAHPGGHTALIQTMQFSQICACSLAGASSLVRGQTCPCCGKATASLILLWIGCRSTGHTNPAQCRTALAHAHTHTHTHLRQGKTQHILLEHGEGWGINHPRDESSYSTFPAGQKQTFTHCPNARWNR